MIMCAVKEGQILSIQLGNKNIYIWLEGCKLNKNLKQINISWSSETYPDSMHAIGDNNKKLWRFWKPTTSKDHALDKIIMIHYPDKQLQQFTKHRELSTKNLIQLQQITKHWEVPPKKLMSAWIEANAYKLICLM